jgi:hypothetical protein
MFRKIRSNRDPRDTVLSELKREFSPYIGKAGSHLQNAASRHSTFIFWLMVVNIALSAILSFTVFRHKESSATAKKPVKILTPVSSGIDGIMETSRALSEMLRLTKAIDSLSGKEQLTPQDSARLEQALDRFQQLNKKFNQRKQ